MIIGATHWLFAVAIAVSIHLAGMLWLSLPVPARQSLIDRTSESIIVTVGPDAHRAAAEAEVLAPEDSAPVTPAAAAGTQQPDTVTDASPAAVSETRSAEQAMDPEAAAPIDPDPVPETTGPEPASVQPELVASKALTGVEWPEPESVAAPEAPASEPDTARARVDVQELAAAGAVEETPVRPEAAEMQVKAEPGITVPTEIADDAPVPEPSGSPVNVDEETPVRPEAAEMQVKAEPGITVPTEIADDAPVPEPSGPPVNVDPAAPIIGAVPEAGAAPAPDASAQVDTASAGRVHQPGSMPEIGPVVVEPDAEPGVAVTAAREPAPAVEPAYEPEVSEAAQPETIELEELQGGSNGSGVAARYAGVLKGWLQENMHYPRAARLAGQEGQVVVRFVIDRDGRVHSIKVESKSGFPLLDREAREMIERGDPFPGMPDDMPGQQLEVRVPVEFHVREETLTKEIPPIYLE